MPMKNSPSAANAQPQDFLAAQLAQGQAPRLSTLLKLEPAAPPPDREFDERFLCLSTPREIEKIRRDAARDEWRFPGLILSWSAAEAAKYRAKWPPEDALLAQHVGRYLLHIRGKWSVEARAANMRFEQYILEYVAGRRPGGYYQPGGRYDLAWQIIRIATGLPRFPATAEAQR